MLSRFFLAGTSQPIPDPLPGAHARRGRAIRGTPVVCRYEGWTRWTFGALFALAMVASLLVACSSPPAPQLDLQPPWQDGAISTFDVRDAAGATVGTAAFSWRKDGNHWKHGFTVDIRGKIDTGEVETDLALRPLRALRETGGAKVEATYGEHEITVHTTSSDGAVTDKTVPRSGYVLDNDESLEAQRALPFADGYEAQYDNVIARNAATVRMRVMVTGSETVTVPAGQFETWRVSMAAGGKPHEAWYAKAPPHLLVQYRNTGSGSVFVLRSWRASADAAVEGDPSPPVLAAPGAVAVNWGLLAAALLVAFPLMMVLPVALGVLFARRLGVSGKLWGLGVLSFVSSQIVHIPLNWSVGLLGGSPRALGTLPMPWIAVVLGLSAGLCEELARYVFLRYAARKAKHTWAEALQFGAGHGGIEAIIIGALLGLTILSMLLLHFVPATTLGVPASSAGEVTAAVDAFWSLPWHGPVIGGLERLSAITAHIGMTVLVMRAISRRNPAYLVAAIAVHTALDAFAVWAMVHLGATWTEVGIGLFAAALLAMTIMMRDRPAMPAAA